ncbi:MAG: AsnC family transcriptional regulator [Gammaproteobacteria bacterium]|nr:AsnC family transcriptional regulator [Gammaproteobacteria bacterium]NKB65109.1 AsnC family transcriptional regulator [Gammaproteobacteria bacterium]
MITTKDKRLIAILKQNARKPISEIARELSLSRTTVQQRLARLEQKGHILGYTTRLGEALRASKISAHVNLVLDPNKSSQVISKLEKLTAIDTLYSVSGNIDLIAILSVDSPLELDQELDNISAVSGVKSTETSIVLGVKFDRSEGVR